jgi:hypothetical protein
MSIRKQIHQIIKEEYNKVLEEEKIKEGIISWAGGVADNILYSVLNNYKSIRQTDIFKDPKIRQLAKDLKISQADLEQRVSDLLQKDNRFLKNLATVRAKYVR